MARARDGRSRRAPRGADSQLGLASPKRAPRRQHDNLVDVSGVVNVVLRPHEPRSPHALLRRRRCAALPGALAQRPEPTKPSSTEKRSCSSRATWREEHRKNSAVRSAAEMKYRQQRVNGVRVVTSSTELQLDAPSGPSAMQLESRVLYARKFAYWITAFGGATTIEDARRRVTTALATVQLEPALRATTSTRTYRRGTTTSTC